MQTRTTLRTLGVLAFAAFAAACDSGTNAPSVDTVIIEADDSEVAVDGTLQLQATAYDDDGDEITGRPVEWSSSNRNIATVSASGLLTGVSPGTVDITAEIGGERDTQTFEVVDECPIIAYTLGSTVNGTLSPGDCVFEDGTRVDLYRFTLTTPRQVVITLRSTAFDSYLVLFNSAGSAIQQDDDSGGGNDARITQSLAAGTYIIGANSYAVSTGAYTLTTQ
ncbi:MAG TPA: DVUA0089 family protein [Longimicrobium sp.]|jgi:hypothetical protein|uniref:DVUA0089 family protein n=1 Tax=Longimicrobium sp. TaxID=2029185 RepID=UPI002ED83D6F